MYLDLAANKIVVKGNCVVMAAVGRWVGGSLNVCVLYGDGPGGNSRKVADEGAKP